MSLLSDLIQSNKELNLFRLTLSSWVGNVDEEKTLCSMIWTMMISCLGSWLALHHRCKHVPPFGPHLFEWSTDCLSIHTFITDVTCWWEKNRLNSSIINKCISFRRLFSFKLSFGAGVRLENMIEAVQMALFHERICAEYCWFGIRQARRGRGSPYHCIYYS